MADVYGLLAEFPQPEDLIAAVGSVRDAGYRRIEAYTPYPVDGLAEALDIRERRIPAVGFLGGVFGAVLALSFQSYIAIDYPLNVGGRPVFSWPAFSVIAFELTILFTALFAIGYMFWRDRLPRLNHPLFGAPRFHLASADRFFLCIESADPHFDVEATQTFLRSLRPVSVARVPL